MDLSLKTFFTIVAVSMLTIGTLTPAIAVSPKTYSFEDNLEVAMPSVAHEQPYVPGEILVKFNPGLSEAKIAAMNSKNGASVTYTSPYAGFKKLKIPKTKSVEEMVEIYSKNPNVEYATANYVMHATMVPNDPRYFEQWNFHSTYGINVTEAWDTSTGQGVVVAVLDTGVAYTAPDLASTSFVPGYDFINGDSNPTDGDGHGTHVTGTIAQSTNNDIGVAGVAFNCDIMPVKVLGDNGSGTLSVLVDGIYYAAENDADVISMSLGFPPHVNARRLAPLFPALDTAYSNGVVIVAAAGNDGMSKIGYPAAYEKCIAVGATGYAGNRAYYSNYGSALDIMAPGGELYINSDNQIVGYGILQNTFNDSGVFDYYLYQGTSMATPHVSGVAALIIANGVTGPENVRAAIENTAQDIYASGWDSDSGYGIVDAYAALDYFEPVQNQPPVAVIAFTPSNPTVDEIITFDASGSTDDKGIVSYSWDFDGAGTGDANTEVATYSYSTAGDHNVALTVTDADGATDTVTETVSVSDNSQTEPFDGTVTVTVDTADTIRGRNFFAYGIATIDVTDNVGNSIDAVVSGQWSGAASDMDTATTTGGTASVVSDSVKYRGTTLDFTFRVNSVTIDGITYDVSESDTGYYPQ
ncbi:S8 family serine peptidase [Methanolobus sp. ZRKC3]|uniref:S8 family serine peptidase n=1 Tax=Methanolobus sp. ZRKC3 TaxID=3125786 RepID=UPI003254A3C8